MSSATLAVASLESEVVALLGPQILNSLLFTPATGTSAWSQVRQDLRFPVPETVSMHPDPLLAWLIVAIDLAHNAYNVKSFKSLKAHLATLISISLALSQTPVFTLWDHGYGASSSHGVPVYVPAFAGTHCTYPRRDGQAELTWVAGYIPGWSPIQVLTVPGLDNFCWYNQWCDQLSWTTTIQSIHQ